MLGVVGVVVLGVVVVPPVDMMNVTGIVAV